MYEENKKELRRLLEKEKTTLEKDLADFATKNPKVPGEWISKFPQFEQDRTQDQEENADEVEEYQNRLGVEHALEARLAEVTDALKRIDTPEYGFCQNCQKQIPLERLRANPAATTCLKC